MNSDLRRAEPFEKLLLEVRALALLADAELRLLRSAGRLQPGEGGRHSSEAPPAHHASALPAAGSGQEFRADLHLVHQLLRQFAAEDAGCGQAGVLILRKFAKARSCSSR